MLTHAAFLQTWTPLAVSVVLTHAALLESFCFLGLPTLLFTPLLQSLQIKRGSWSDKRIFVLNDSVLFLIKILLISKSTYGNKILFTIFYGPHHYLTNNQSESGSGNFLGNLNNLSWTFQEVTNETVRYRYTLVNKHSLKTQGGGSPKTACPSPYGPRISKIFSKKRSLAKFRRAQKIVGAHC